ncbi:hypothetical protein [Comamonas sp. B-9]|uniref:hypothetical protein n=1 Tax=Comamonas sp. B-9 TaxID=1055192 RepID=UPI000395940D|nr:hypothetical protein [Comamonas sp. B-9]
MKMFYAQKTGSLGRMHGALLAAGLLSVAAVSAEAQTVDFSAPGVHSYTVPAGVHALDVVLAGGGGGSGTGIEMVMGMAGFDGSFPGGSGGNGAQLSTRVAVSPGDVLSITVAQGGGAGVDRQTMLDPAEGGLGGQGAGSGGRSADGAIGQSPAIDPIYTAGGGGGASALEIPGRLYLRAGGGGGGSSAAYGQSLRDVGVSGLAAPLALNNTADCSTPADGGQGLASADGMSGGGSTIATGAGGGGGYMNGAGAGGASGAGTMSDNGNWWWVHATKPSSATGGGSCYYAAAAAYTISNTQLAVGALGAVVDPASLPSFPPGENLQGLPGANGWARITPIVTTTPNVPISSATPVPGLGWHALALLAIGIAALACVRHPQHKLLG